MMLSEEDQQKYDESIAKISHIIASGTIEYGRKRRMYDEEFRRVLASGTKMTWLHFLEQQGDPEFFEMEKERRRK